VNQQSIEIAGQLIAYLDSPGGQAGRDDRAVIFVHGNSSSARTWLPVLTGSFGQQFRCLALDLPGHRQSGPGDIDGRPTVGDVWTDIDSVN
jgi:pimeloyl-ACP methyl ester carboxylesterase